MADKGGDDASYFTHSGGHTDARVADHCGIELRSPYVDGGIVTGGAEPTECG